MTGEDEIMYEGRVPVCFPLPLRGNTGATAQNAHASVSGHRLHGADDLISLFGLRPLWQQAVQPYAVSSKLAKQSASTDASTKKAGSADNVAGAKVMEKTYAEYVQDLPGKVRPAKRTGTRYHNSVNAAIAAGEPPPPLPEEITGRTTMRDIVFRPETTIQRVGPFDGEALRAAFTVEAGDEPQLDLSLLESDEIERHSPTKKKKKRKHQREATDRSNVSDEVASKRARLNSLVNPKALV